MDINVFFSFFFQIPTISLYQNVFKTMKNIYFSKVEHQK